MRKNVLALSIQAMFGGYHTNTQPELLRVRYRIPPHPEDTLDFRVFFDTSAKRVDK